jgi:hypothetical protein
MSAEYSPYAQYTTRGAPSDETNFHPTRVTSAGAVGLAGIVLKASAGRLYRLDALNVGAVALYLLVFDKATAPFNTDVPIWRRRLPASGEVSIDFADFGLFGASGLSIAISTTPTTLTLAVSADLVYSAHLK